MYSLPLNTCSFTLSGNFWIEILKLDQVSEVFSFIDAPILFLNNTTLSSLNNINIETGYEETLENDIILEYNKGNFPIRIITGNSLYMKKIVSTAVHNQKFKSKEELHNVV